MTYAQLLNSHIYPYIGKRRVAEIGRETIHRLLTVVLPEQGASQGTVVNDLLAHAARTRPPGLRALVVGIQHYQHYPELPSAASDMRRIEQLLRLTSAADGG